MARAEDRAPWRHDPSADPGTKTEGGRHDAALSSPSGLVRKRQIEAVCPRVHYLISQPRFLHFTLNHYTLLSSSRNRSGPRTRPVAIQKDRAVRRQIDTLFNLGVI